MSDEPQRLTLNNSSGEEKTVTFLWHGEPIDLELSRHNPVIFDAVETWEGGDMGVSFGIEETSRKIIVTTSKRLSVHVGDTLEAVDGQEVTETTFPEIMQAATATASPDRPVLIEISPPPPPVNVKSCGDALQQRGVTQTFELQMVAGHPVQYLTMKVINELLELSPRPCELVFIKRRENPLVQRLQHQVSLQHQAYQGSRVMQRVRGEKDDTQAMRAIVPSVGYEMSRTFLLTSVVSGCCTVS
ncbi:TPA: hypothetical protein N0F65_005638 [Lagenidium giganteum]|uniref:PDZ domain-containing protein n=1 Tax=Lagenidium giganteum TaxID=4803 RepID=A0AAV2YYB8_9STRA|nr:TPA: hypothetical protein N0F65_005638 [Lagenidium giganteum]